MKKKNFVLSYLPATLREHKQNKWYIEYSQLNPTSLKLQRFRKTYNINRIKHLPARRKRAAEIIAYINPLLPLGYPYNEVKGEVQVVSMRLVDAMAFVLKLKDKSKRYNAKRTMKSTHDIFVEWLRLEGLQDMVVSDFNQAAAQKYMDYAVLVRDVGNRTFNNYLTKLSVFFNEFVRREWMVMNPLKNIPRKREESPKRRKFTKKERRVVANYFLEKNIWMFYGILLQYYCFIRPVELIRLKPVYFDLQRGAIDLPGEITKTHEARTATIPDAILHYFLDPRFTEIPVRHFIFGRGVVPGPVGYIRGDKMYKDHKKGLKHLYAIGKLDNIDMLTWYSWKYTGNADAKDENSISIEDIQLQNGHQSLDQTKSYFLRHSTAVNQNFKKRVFDLL